MIFRPELAAKIVTGKKTATRRALSDNPRSPWWRERSTYERGQVFAVQPGRGVPWVANAVVTRVKIEPLSRLLPVDARREGFNTRDAFVAAWREINGSWDPDQPVHVIEFERVGAECPACHGTGRQPWQPLPNMQTTRDCSDCYGTGVVVSVAAVKLLAELA